MLKSAEQHVEECKANGPRTMQPLTLDNAAVLELNSDAFLPQLHEKSEARLIIKKEDVYRNESREGAYIPDELHGCERNAERV